MMIRSDAKTNFTWVHNVFIRDKRMSLAERGLLLLLMSLPITWKYTVAGLAAMVADGRDRVSSTLKALEEHGYLVREQQFDEKGNFTDVMYKFSDEPIFLNDKPPLSEDDFTKISTSSEPEEENSAASSPFTENPYTDSAVTENPQQIIKDNNKTLIYKSTKKEVLCCGAAPQAADEAGKARKKGSKKAIKTDIAVYEEIVGYLNSRLNTHYKATTVLTQELIDARLNEGNSIEDFKAVIDRMASEWADTEMSKYLRPKTLFNDNFEGYLNAPAYTGNNDRREQHSTQAALKDYSVDMMDLLNEYLGE